ncbi:MAG TPA: choice-of-anchor E domain-containing protein [Humisphaera sp.]|jgi:hypothetical protein|nr:choice-of-anchor E domain-containing protein [Humisphaera sp.]
MRKSTVYRCWAAALIASFCSATVTNAGSVVQSRIMTVHSSPISTGLSFDPFDDSMGQLTGVTISGQVMLSASVQVYNATGNSQRFDNAMAAFQLTVSEPDGLQTGAQIASVASGTAAPGLGVFGKVTHSQALLSIHVPQAFWSNYEEKSVHKVSIGVNEGPGTFGGRAVSGVFFGGIATAAAYIRLEYDFAAAAASPVPLPAEAAAVCAMVGSYVAIRLIAARRRIV